MIIYLVHFVFIYVYTFKFYKFTFILIAYIPYLLRTALCAVSFFVDLHDVKYKFQRIWNFGQKFQHHMNNFLTPRFEWVCFQSYCKTNNEEYVRFLWYIRHGWATEACSFIKNIHQCIKIFQESLNPRSKHLINVVLCRLLVSQLTGYYMKGLTCGAFQQLFL